MSLIAALALGAASPLPLPQLWQDKATRCLYMLIAKAGGSFVATLTKHCIIEGLKSTCPKTIYFYPPNKGTTKGKGKL